MKYIKEYENIFRRFSGLSDFQYLSIQKTKEFARKILDFLKLLDLGKIQMKKLPTPDKSIVNFGIVINGGELLRICWAIDSGLQVLIHSTDSDIRKFLFDIFNKYTKQKQSGNFITTFSIPWYSIEVILDELEKEKYEVYTYTSKYNL